MSCDTVRRPNQSLDQRKTEVRGAIASLAALLASGEARAIVSRATGSIAFRGWTEGETARVTDACGYRLVMSGKNTLAKLAIARAETLAGRTVDRKAEVHSHDGGVTYHKNH